MSRRRRRGSREIAFSFDSFLDVVANVVGIILRLILVAWVGARTYKANLPAPPPTPPALTEPAELPEPTDEREQTFPARRQQLADQTRRIEQHQGKQRAMIDTRKQMQRDLNALLARQRELSAQQESLKTGAAGQSAAAGKIKLSLSELQKRSHKLLAEIDELRKRPVANKVLRYQTPVSRPVREEVMFECKKGRVTLLDTASLLEEVRRVIQDKGKQLATRWQVIDTTSPVGAFKLRYIVERSRDSLDGPGDTAPSGDSPYRYGLSGWEAVPVRDVRGETVEEALKKGSAFRHIIDKLDGQQTAVTFWVYPDSFPIYRTLRDHLHAKEVTVAGRPLPDGVPIASSRRGTVSRGQ